MYKCSQNKKEKRKKENPVGVWNILNGMNGIHITNSEDQLYLFPSEMKIKSIFTSSLIM